MNPEIEKYQEAIIQVFEKKQYLRAIILQEELNIYLNKIDNKE